jgi:hypothetical protein
LIEEAFTWLYDKVVMFFDRMCGVVPFPLFCDFMILIAFGLGIYLVFKILGKFLAAIFIAFILLIVFI